MFCEEYCLRLTCCNANKCGFHIENMGDTLMNSKCTNVKKDIKMSFLN